MLNLPLDIAIPLARVCQRCVAGHERDGIIWFIMTIISCCLALSLFLIILTVIMMVMVIIIAIISLAMAAA